MLSKSKINLDNILLLFMLIYLVFKEQEMTSLYNRQNNQNNSDNKPPSNKGKVFLILGIVIGCALTFGISNIPILNLRNAFSNQGDGTITSSTNTQNNSDQTKESNKAEDSSNIFSNSDGNNVSTNGDVTDIDGSRGINNEPIKAIAEENSNVNVKKVRSEGNSPNISSEGGTQTITIEYRNSNLPGFKPQSNDYKIPPSDLSKYDVDSDLKQDSLVLQDSSYLSFGKEEKLVGMKVKPVLFSLSPKVNESRFTFKLNGNQKAILLQFALPDLPAGSQSSDVYKVKIYAEAELLWAGECKRSQGKQLVSVPLDIPNASTITIEATSNNRRNSNLYFTQAKLFI